MGELDSREYADAAARAFAGEHATAELTPLGAGLIHQTFAVPLRARRGGGAPGEIVIQRVNTDVFRDPQALMQNLERITTHLRATREAEGASDVERQVLQVLRTDSGDMIFVDPAGGVWRAFPRIRGGVGLGASRDSARLTSAARAFGDYARRLATLPGPPLHTTLPAFHDFARRRRDFDAARSADACGRAAEAAEVLDTLVAACEWLESVLPLTTVSALPVRVAHHDCKLDNLLFDAATGAALCVLDLDTSMPGRLLSDFGELVRSSTAGAAGEAAVEAVSLDLDAFDALATGYLGVLSELLSAEEREAMPLAGAHMALMNALRFATDHLAGDVYFRIFEPGQNLARAAAQTRLGEAMLRAERELRERVSRVLTEV